MSRIISKGISRDKCLPLIKLWIVPGNLQWHYPHYRRRHRNQIRRTRYQIMLNLLQRVILIGPFIAVVFRAMEEERV